MTQTRGNYINPYQPADAIAPARRKRKRGCLGSIVAFFWKLFLLFFSISLLFGLLVVASYSVITGYIRGEEIDAPDLIARPMNEALRKMKEQDLTMLMDREEPSDAVGPGEIISQNPKPGSKIKARSPIHVIVSSGPKHLTLPEDLVGISRREAGLRINKMGLQVDKVSYINIPGQPNDIVLATDPPPGTGVPRKSAINLLVASDLTDKQSVVPNLEGLTLDLARAELSRFGLQIEKVEMQPNDKIEPGTIYLQTPHVGASITPDTHVQVVVAPIRTPEPTKTPAAPEATPTPAAPGDPAAPAVPGAEKTPSAAPTVDEEVESEKTPEEDEPTVPTVDLGDDDVDQMEEGEDPNRDPN